MLQGFNILDYYESIDLQKWESLDNKDAVYIFDNGINPPFYLVSNATGYSATVILYNAVTGEDAGSAQTVTVTKSAGINYAKFLGITDPFDCGYYYQKITFAIPDHIDYQTRVVVDGGTVEGLSNVETILVSLGATQTVYYSEVFKWEDDVSELLKITATSANLTMGNTYELDIDDITFECYVDAEESSEEPEITEEGVEKPYGDIPVFNTLNNVFEFSIFASKPMIRFLFGLRILETNGTITFTYNGRVISAYDIKTEKGDSIGHDDTLLINIKFKETNYISSRNEI